MVKNKVYAAARGSKVVNEGIKYDALSAADREQLEQVWEYEQLTKDPDEEWQPRDINVGEIYKYIYNTDTIDKMLQDLMTNGIKVQSGEVIGKSIIFAMNSKTANLIVERFNRLYPQFGPEFCVQIDYSINYAQDLIDKFSLRDKMPQIAVSVDMLDTGIDVPDVLNLVFFKRVRSRIKFMQMIGRGTRLSPDIFGPGKDKEQFQIFDWGGNFKFFSQNSKEGKVITPPSLTERLFGIRADIACALQAAQYQADPFAKQMHDDLKAVLQTDIGKLDDNHISVRNHWDSVSKFRNPEAWLCLTAPDVLELKNKIAPIVPTTAGDELAKKFDLLVLLVQLGLVDTKYSTAPQEGQITRIGTALEKRASIPDVQRKLPTIRLMQSKNFWENKSLKSLEDMRLEIRDLLKYLEGSAGKTFVVSIGDHVTDEGEAPEIDTTVSYGDKVMDYINSHTDHPVLKKIKNLEQLTEADINQLELVMWQELGTKEDYCRYLRHGKMTDGIPVAAFIRTIVGLDRQKAIRMFSDYISANQLTAAQQEFINSILNYVCQNGDMAKSELVTNKSLSAPLSKHFPDKTAQVGKFVAKLHDIITVA